MNREPQVQPENTPPAPATETAEEKLSPAAAFLDYADVFVWSIFALLLVFILLFRLCNVNGSSMENTLYNGELLILNSLESTYEQDDVIVFHIADRSTEKTLVKRIVATENQTVEINFETGVITVDGVVYEDTHSVLKSRVTDRITGEYALRADYNYDPATGIFRATVPEGHVFVMGDNRNNSADSRSRAIGFVDERTILGRAVFRLLPFTVF